MATICPTITAENEHQYREQVERVTKFAKTIHIDFMDGHFTPTKSPPVEKAWWPKDVTAHFHLMYQMPYDHIEAIIKLKPELVIVHAEADADQALSLVTGLSGLQSTRVGVALLAGTDPMDEAVYGLVSQADHVLIFSGDLGHHGGIANLELLDKIAKIKKIAPAAEIGWDGGINIDNISQLFDSGVDVLNVGSSVQHARNPRKAYDQLKKIVT
jgi:ribulose-phosphate 3-epimerase